ncbi:unnamed protein product [Paramecium octaurelia]|uniref:Tetratricopeptide repeat protein n=1 Tax=Paramecium octaurelia TaxID=43137 RepID=A0A8S1WB86_PAROT|nr:unnamed protein product [Paramecium octaurelia]
MIQQASLKLKCQEDNHKEEIDFICYHEFFNSLIPFIESNNKECDNLIDDLNKCVETLNQSFSQLTKGIRNKYSLVKERLVNMNSYQINDYLNSTIKLMEYKQSISKIIQEQIKKLNHAFNNLYEQLQLSSFNYYQIDENNIQRAEDLCNQGKKLYSDLNYNEALTYFDKSIVINPSNQESLLYKGFNKSIIIIGSCLRMLNKYEDAITWLDKALAIDPKHVVSLCIKGDCLRLLKQFDKSEKILHQAIQLNPNHTVSLDSLGICLQDQQKYQEALIYYERSLKVQSNNQWTKNQKEFCEQKLIK